MNNIYKTILASAFIFASSQNLFSEINIEKIKDKSLDLANLVEAILSNKEPDTKSHEKIKNDKFGYFIQCSLPNEALNTFAEASNSKVENFDGEKYVFAEPNMAAHLAGNKLYVEEVSDMDAYRRSLIPQSAAKQKPEPKIKKPIKQKRLEEKVEISIKTEKAEEIPDYSSALKKVYEKNPVLSYLLYCKINNQQIKEDDFKKYGELEEIFEVDDNKDYAVHSLSPSEDMRFIREAFGVDGDTIAINSKAYLNFYGSNEGMIIINKIKETDE